MSQKLCHTFPSSSSRWLMNSLRECCKEAATSSIFIQFSQLLDYMESNSKCLLRFYFFKESATSSILIQSKRKTIQTQLLDYGNHFLSLLICTTLIGNTKIHLKGVEIILGKQVFHIDSLWI